MLVTTSVSHADRPGETEARYARRVSEKPPKPGAIADAEALSGSDEAQAHVRRWWRLVPRLLTRPTEVFVALQDDDEVDVDARSEPILAIVIVAGMAGILLTPAWATLIDEESLDWIVLAVITFIGGLFYGAAGYFLLGARRVARRPRRRPRRPRAHGAAARRLRRASRSRSRSSSPCRRSWSRSATTGSGPAARTTAPAVPSFSRSGWRSRSGRSACSRSACGRRFELPWRGVIGALALAA